jgi:hypothetical protein
MTDVFSTYDAAELAKNYRTNGKAPMQRMVHHSADKHKNKKTKHLQPLSKIVYSSESDVDSDTLSKIAKPVTKPTRSKRKKSNLRERIEKKRNSRKKKDSDDDDGDSSEEEEEDRISADEVANLQADIQAPASRGRRTSKIQWSSSEDAVLRRLYKLYAGSHSVFTMIANDPSLEGLGGKKNAQKIEKRVQQLELHLELANMLSSDDEEEGNDESGESSSDSSDASVSGKSGDEMSVDGDEEKVDISKKRKRKDKRDKRKEKGKKKKKLKSKSSSKYFLNPEDKDQAKVSGGEDEEGGAINDDDLDFSILHEHSDRDEEEEEEETARSIYSLSSPQEIYSHERSGGGQKVPFWEEDLDDVDDESSFDRRMNALAAASVTGDGDDMNAKTRHQHQVEFERKARDFDRQHGLQQEEVAVHHLGLPHENAKEHTHFLHGHIDTSVGDGDDMNAETRHQHQVEFERKARDFDRQHGLQQEEVAVHHLDLPHENAKEHTHFLHGHIDISAASAPSPKKKKNKSLLKKGKKTTVGVDFQLPDDSGSELDIEEEEDAKETAGGGGNRFTRSFVLIDSDDDDE